MKNLPCNDTLELIATVALLTLLHKAIATVTSIYGLPEVMKNLRKILSIILLSYNAFGLQKLDTEPQTPRTCHQKIFQKKITFVQGERTSWLCFLPLFEYLDIKNLPFVSTSFGVQSFLSSGSCLAPKACISS